jgi:hypothetical protein
MESQQEDIVRATVDEKVIRAIIDAITAQQKSFTKTGEIPVNFMANTIQVLLPLVLGKSRWILLKLTKTDLILANYQVIMKQKQMSAPEGETKAQVNEQEKRPFDINSETRPPEPAWYKDKQYVVIGESETFVIPFMSEEDAKKLTT